MLMRDVFGIRMVEYLVLGMICGVSFNRLGLDI
jgi:hypothetical protein